MRKAQSLSLSFLGLAGLVLSLPGMAWAESQSSTNVCPSPAIEVSSDRLVPVTKKNYAKAETSDILKDYVQKIAKHESNKGMGAFMHKKSAMDPADRTILRANFDTLYSFVVLDLATPASIVLPEIDRYQILEVVSDEHWAPWSAISLGAMN